MMTGVHILSQMMTGVQTLKHDDRTTDMITDDKWAHTLLQMITGVQTLSQ